MSDSSKRLLIGAVVGIALLLFALHVREQRARARAGLGVPHQRPPHRPRGQRLTSGEPRALAFSQMPLAGGRGARTRGQAHARGRGARDRARQ